MKDERKVSTTFSDPISPILHFLHKGAKLIKVKEYKEQKSVLWNVPSLFDELILQM